MKLLGKRRTINHGPLRIVWTGWWPSSISTALPFIPYRLRLWGRKRR